MALVDDIMRDYGIALPTARTAEWEALTVDDRLLRAEVAARLLLNVIGQLPSSSDLGEPEAHRLLGDRGWGDEDDD